MSGLVPQITKPSEQKVGVELKNGNIAYNWSKFVKKLENYFIAIKQDMTDETQKYGIMISEAGEEALEIYETFVEELKETKVETPGAKAGDPPIITTVDKSKNYTEVMKKFDHYVAQAKNVILCREEFHVRDQKEGELFTSWLTDLKTLVQHCEWGDMTDTMLKGRII